MKILIVEDNAVNAELASIVLKRASFEVFLAPDAYRALEILSEQPDMPIVLVDLHLPGMSGRELVKKIRETDQKIKLVAFTASAMIADVEQTLREGFDGYITKPIDIATFVSKIRGIL